MNVITLTNFSTSNLHSNTSSIRIMDKEDTPRELTLVEIIDEHTIRVQEDPTEFATEDGRWRRDTGFGNGFDDVVSSADGVEIKLRLRYACQL